MKRRDFIVGASTVAVTLIATGMTAWALARMPWFLRWRGDDYVAALGALAGAAAAVFTLGAATFAIMYAALTYRLWQETAAHRESDLMLRLMHEYDGLRGAIQDIQQYSSQCALSGPTDPAARFRAEMANVDFVDDQEARAVDEPRFRVSRFFVRTRKLVRAGFLSRRVVIAALDRQAIEDVFLRLIDPLDEAKAGKRYKRDDRDFFEALLKQYPSPGKDWRIGYHSKAVPAT